MLVPKSFTRREFLEVALITISCNIIIIGQGILYCICLAMLDAVPSAYRVLVFIPFILVKVQMNWLVGVICRYANALPIRIIFINNNAMINRMLLCWALASKFDLLPIILVASTDTLQSIAHIFFVCGPLQVHMSTWREWPFMLVCWILGREWSSTKPLTRKETAEAIAERAK